MKMTFGKHEGKEISKLSHEYCSTLLNYKFGQHRLTPEMIDALQARIDAIESTQKWKDWQEKMDREIAEVIADPTWPFG